MLTICFVDSDKDTVIAAMQAEAQATAASVQEAMVKLRVLQEQSSLMDQLKAVVFGELTKSLSLSLSVYIYIYI